MFTGPVIAVKPLPRSRFLPNNSNVFSLFREINMKSFALGDERLLPETLVTLGRGAVDSLKISDTARERLRGFRAKVENAMRSGNTIYGINTGFGFLSDVKIETDKLDQLQENLIRSHACGVGDPMAPDVVRAMLVLRAHTFLLGHSGVTESCLETILAFLKNDILPIIPSQGSVGASGDLAPLAHLAMGLMGEGEVVFKGKRCPAKEALAQAGVRPLKPQAKEGLSLINGTQFMTTVASFAGL
jgi:histidine ammonia-lyase